MGPGHLPEAQDRELDGPGPTWGPRDQLLLNPTWVAGVRSRHTTCTTITLWFTGHHIPNQGPRGRRQKERPPRSPQRHSHPAEGSAAPPGFPPETARCGRQTVHLSAFLSAVMQWQSREGGKLQRVRLTGDRRPDLPLLSLAHRSPPPPHT